MYEFFLKDRRGIEHRYTLEPHPPSLGVPLLMKLNGLAVEPIAEFVRGLVQLQSVQDVDWGESDDKAQRLAMMADVAAEVAPLLQGLDVAKMAGALSGLLGYSGGPAMVKEFTRFAKRDGESVHEHYDTIFAGNYLELTLLVWEVVQHNGFLPWLEPLRDSAIGKMVAEMVAELRELDLETSSSDSTPTSSHLPRVEVPEPALRSSTPTSD